MANLNQLFYINQKLKIKNKDFDLVKIFHNGIVKEVYEDHIIVTNTDLGVDGWYEEGYNIDCLFPIYNF